MRITLFVPCFVDLIHPQVAISMVQILERLGHTVECPQELACCGQPAFNSGYWDESRAIAVNVLSRLKDAEAVVVASGSCGAMLKVFYPELFAKTPHLDATKSLSARTWEFSDFLVTRLGLSDVGARFPARVTFHDGCHGLRALRIKPPPRVLLSKVPDLQLMDMKAAETSSRFGGALAAKFPMISPAMGDVKSPSAAPTDPPYTPPHHPTSLPHPQTPPTPPPH